MVTTVARTFPFICGFALVCAVDFRSPPQRAPYVCSATDCHHLSIAVTVVFTASWCCLQKKSKGCVFVTVSRR